MCNVCVARDALATSSCGKDDCVAFETGHRHVWSKGPILKQARRKSVRKKDGGLIFLPVARRPKQPTVYIRARGRDAEGRAQFQLRREHELWPKTWQTTDDLANAVAMYGLDSHWGRGPQARPAVAHLRDVRDAVARRAPRAAGATERAQERPPHGRDASTCPAGRAPRRSAARLRHASLARMKHGAKRATVVLPCLALALALAPSIVRDRGVPSTRSGGASRSTS